MHYQLTPDLAKRLIDSVTRYPDLSTCAMANGVLPDTLSDWLAAGYKPYPPEPYGSFAQAFTATVAVHKAILLQEALDIATKSQQAKILMELAQNYTTELPPAGPLLQAMAKRFSIDGNKAALRQVIRARGREFMEILDELGLDLVDKPPSK